MSIASPSISLERLIELAPPATEQWIAIADAVLQALEGEGPDAGHLRLDMSDIRVNAAGEVEIARRQRAPAKNADEAGVQALGHLICNSLGGLTGTSALGEPLIFVTLDALAIGALGRTAAAARPNFRRQLVALTSESNVAARRHELAALVTRIHRGDVPRLHREGPIPRPRRRALSAPSIGGLATMIVATLALLVLVSSGFLAPAHPHTRQAPVIAPLPSTDLSVLPPTPIPTDAPVAIPPAPAPSSAGIMRSVSLSLTPSCSVGGRCTGTVELHFAGGHGPTPLAWSVRFYDSCGGPASNLSTGAFTAPAGWNTVIAQTSFELAPSGHRGWLIVVSSSPAEVGSPALDVGGPIC